VEKAAVTDLNSGEVVLTYIQNNYALYANYSRNTVRVIVHSDNTMYVQYGMVVLLVLFFLPLALYGTIPTLLLVVKFFFLVAPKNYITPYHS
jgi:hypothetical protein